MWASESTISAAISRLHIHNSHRLHHLSQQTINAGTKLSPITNNSHCGLLRQCNKNNNISHRHNHNLNLCQNMEKAAITSHHQECKKTSSDSRLMKLSSLTPQSLPSTPLTSTKHLSTSRYTDYENYLYI